MPINPLGCADPYAPIMYLGKPGALTAMKLPDVGYSRDLSDGFAVHNLLEGCSVDRSPYGQRIWELSHTWLYPDTASYMYEYATRQRGVGPFVFIDPHTKNKLSPNQASGTDSLTNTEGFHTNPVIETVIDTFSRTVTGGWGAASSGQVYTVVTTPADYSVGTAAGNGDIRPSATGSDRFAYLTADAGNDRVVYVSSAFVTLPATGTLQMGVIPRMLDTSNHYNVQISVTPLGVGTMSIAKRVAGAGTNILSALVSPTIVANTLWTIKVQIIGSSIYAKAWPTAAGEPSSWQMMVTDTSIPIGQLAGVIARNNTAVTTHIMRTDYFESITADESLASSTVTSVRGDRSLAWSLPATVTAGVLSLDPPSGLYGWATPVNIPWSFSGWIKGGGTDSDITVSPIITWKTKNNVQSGVPVTGTSIVTNSSTFQKFCVSGTAPIDGYITVQLNATSATVTGAAVVYLDEVQLEMNSTCSTWEYGDGQPIVSVRVANENVPRIRRASLSFELVEVTP